ncbi:NAD(P)-dependent oxidoreductase, partial [Elizabethkingia anophelis]|nr:NAD(P)-dependent oxidoreductase [Elizabethkingia anophelis]
MMKTAFITGATSGIGKATAKRLGNEGYKLILCGRRKEILEELERELSEKTDVYTLTFDVRNYDEVKTAIDSLPAEWKAIDVLLNNAGNAHGLEPLSEGKVSDWDMMMDGNVKGLLYVSKCIIPGMKERNPGHI